MSQARREAGLSAEGRQLLKEGLTQARREAEGRRDAEAALGAETAGAPDGRSRPGWSVTAAVSASANHRRSHRTQRARARTASGVSSRPRGRGCESTSRCGTGSSADGAKKRRRLWPKKRRHAEPVCVRRSAMRGIAAGGRCKNEK